MKAQFLSKKKIKLVWEIAEKCYLYKDNLSISSSVENKIQIFNSSEGIIKKDEYFGEVEVFYSQAEIYIDIDKWEKNPLKVTYQGCNELGYCYPPVDAHRCYPPVCLLSIVGRSPNSINQFLFSFSLNHSKQKLLKIPK